MKLKNSVCLITGSAVRVGRSIALNLAQKGALIAIHYHTQQKESEQIQKEIINLGTDTLILQGDISHKNDWHKMRDIIMRKWGRIDILINNASIFYRTPFFEISDKDWDKFMDINLKGTFYGCQIFGEIMYKNHKGKIINIADVSAESVWPSYIPYCISKAGVIALTKGLAKALAPYVTVNAISPGTVLLANKYDKEEEDYLINRTPLKRVGQPEDIAKTVAFLLEGSDFITGAILNVDGGRSLT